VCTTIIEDTKMARYIVECMIARGFLERWLDSHRLRVYIGVGDAKEVTTSSERFEGDRSDLID
jgi:hypothetical protein